MKIKQNKIKIEEMNENELVGAIEKSHKDSTGEKISLKAKKADDTVNGYVTTHYEGSNLVANVVYYLEDEDPTFEVYEYNGVKYSRGSKITKRAVRGFNKVENKEVMI